MQVITVSEARANLFQLVDQVAECAEPVMLFGKRNKAILISEESWRSIQETLYLSSIPGMVESIKEGMNTPIEECTDKIEWE